MAVSRVRWFGRAIGVIVGAVAAVAATASVPVVAQSGGFSDVPGDAYYSAPVASLAEQGVFVGTECEAGFCPGDPIDRKTMAVWIVRILDGEDPEAVSESRFDDVDASGFFAAFIERMAALEVTRGCGDGSGFCPDRHVTRAQMAVFLSRAYKLPEGPDPVFVDVLFDAWYAADVARLAASKITGGCGDGSRFCPNRETTRSQLATFLYRAEQRSETGSTFEADRSSSQSESPSVAYLWQDGNRTRTARLVTDLVLEPNDGNPPSGPVIPWGNDHRIVARQKRHDQTATQPVFRSESGALMTLPGGLLLAFDASWDQDAIDSFLAEHGIALSRVSPRGFATNAFFVETEAGFASLDLSKELARLEGVILSSPNWRRETVVR